MFVGETGISRVVQRTCEAMKAAGISDPDDIAKVRALGVIDLPTIQKKLNLHYSLSLDLFGLGSSRPMPRTPSTPASRAATRRRRSRTIIACRTRPIRCSS